ncbi:MAG: SMP-30/gluconolactonase/LRE family protein [Nocardioidaceae bacterium]
MTTAPRVLASGFRFLEGPRWHAGAVWVSDMHDDKVMAFSEQGELLQVIEVPGPSGLGWLPDGSLVVAATKERTIYRHTASGLQVHADLTGIGIVDHEINDLWTDDVGRCFVGEFGVHVHEWMHDHIPENLDENSLNQIATAPFPNAAVFVVEPDGMVAVAAEEMRFPNGAVVTDQNSRFVVAETFGLRMSEFDLADGVLSNRRIWDIGFAPDGIAEPDADGNFWVANPLGGSAVLVAPGGQHLATIQAERGVYACALGGHDGHTLFLCTSTTADPAVSGEMWDARLESVRVETGLARTS